MSLGSKQSHEDHEHKAGASAHSVPMGLEEAPGPVGAQPGQLLKGCTLTRFLWEGRATS